MTWFAAAAGYVAADMLTGSTFSFSALINGTNLIGVAVGAGVYRRLPREVLRLRLPMDTIYIVAVFAAASACTAISGAIVGPLLLGMDWLLSLNLWFTGEFASYAVFVPVIITIRHIPVSGPNTSLGAGRWRQIGAISTILASIAYMHAAGGPGAIAFTIPSLIWCAICFTPAVSSVIAAATCVWLLIAGPAGIIPFNFDLTAPGAIASYRLGVGMLAIGTFAVSGLNAAWLAGNEALQLAATRDELSGLHNRRSFMEQAQHALARRDAETFYLLMLDMDHFKSVNDQHGHAAGDAVIRAIGEVISANLSPRDFAGRIGGEEFAIGLYSRSPTEASNAAESLRNAVSQLQIDGYGAEPLTVTISVGLTNKPAAADLSQMLSAADAALYAAKHGGRNRLVAAF